MPTSRRQLSSNNASTTLASDISSSDVVITVRDASRFPVPGANEFFIATIDNGVNIEIVEVTSRVGNSLLGVVRALEGTNAAYFSAGSKVEVRVTAGYLNSLEDLKETVQDLAGGNTVFENVSRIVFSDVPGASTARGVAWNNQEQTLDITLGSTGVVLQTGQELLYRVRNGSGQLLPDGTVVVATGTLGNSGRIVVGPGVANGTVEGKYFMGLVTEPIANGADGFVTHFGKVRGIPTNGADVGESWADGDVLYAHPTISGKLTKVKPSIPNEIVTMAIVLNAHGTNGTLVVRPTVDSHAASVAKYTPLAGAAVSVQDKIRDLESRGGTGGGGDVVFYENDTAITTSYTITTGKNAMTAGPITINAGATVTVPSGSTWTIV